MERSLKHWIRQAYAAVRKKVYVAAFPVLQRWGLHISSTHYAHPIPDTARLKEDLWKTASDLVGIDMDPAGQQRLLAGFAAAYRDEYERFPLTRTADPLRYFSGNDQFSAVDGEMLYCMVRHFKPRRIFEIGSGFSTMLAAEALRANARDGGASGELVVCDPYPGETVGRGLPGVTKLIRRPVQDVPREEFLSLRDRDILFIDSSHVACAGSDVQYEILEILPRLPAGVIVHVHDIFFPGEYPREWVTRDFIFLNEQYLLQAFLTFNREYEVLWAGAYMHRYHPALLAAAFPSYRSQRGTVGPGSFWMRRIAKDTSV